MGSNEPQKIKPIYKNHHGKAYILLFRGFY